MLAMSNNGIIAAGVKPDPYDICANMYRV